MTTGIRGQYPLLWRLVLTGYRRLRMHRLTTLFFSLVALPVTLLGLVACGTDEGFVEPIAVPSGFVRVVNAIPESPLLAVLIENRTQETLNFSEGTAFFGVLPTLPREFSVIYATDAENQTLLTRQFEVGISEQRSLILAGTLAAPSLIDISTIPLTTDTNTFTEVTIVHAANSYPAEVGFMLVQNGDFNAPTTALLGQFSSSLTLTPTSGTNYELFAVTTLPASGTAPANADILWRSGIFDLPNTTQPLLALIDYFGPGGQTVKVTSISPTGTQAFALEDIPAAIRVVNALPDQGPIDVYLNDSLFLANPQVGVLNDYKLTNFRGAAVFKITPAGDPTTVLLEIAPTVTQGIFHALIISGLASDASYAMALTTEDNRTIPSRMVITGTQASPSAPGFLDYYFLASGETLESSNPRSVNNSLLIATSFVVLPGAYDLVITETGVKTALFGPLPVNVANDAIYRFFVTDAPGGGTPLQVILADDFL